MALEPFKETFGTVVEDLRADGPFLCVYYYPLYIVRRLVFVAILIPLGNYPLFQLAATLLLVLVPVPCS